MLTLKNLYTQYGTSLWSSLAVMIPKSAMLMLLVMLFFIMHVQCESFAKRSSRNGDQSARKCVDREMSDKLAGIVVTSFGSLQHSC